MAKRSDRFFWAQVYGTDPLGCWEWCARRDREGYGFFWDGEERVRAHRYSYELLRAEIPEGLVIDHLCRNRACVNPWHMEPVTVRVNILRGHAPSAINAAATHCIYGHPFDDANTYVTRAGRRRCRTCHARRCEERRRRGSNAQGPEARPVSSRVPSPTVG